MLPIVMFLQLSLFFRYEVEAEKDRERYSKEKKEYQEAIKVSNSRISTDHEELADVT